MAMVFVVFCYCYPLLCGLMALTGWVVINSLIFHEQCKLNYTKSKFYITFIVLYTYKGVLMNHKIVTICRVAIAASMGALIPWVIATGNPLLPVILFAAGITFTWLLVRKDQQTLVDERAQLINQKTSASSMYVFLLGTTIIGLVLATLGNSGYPDFSSIGYTLMYSALGLLMLHLIFGIYYRRKYGG